MEQERELEQRIRALERKLERHHEWLEESLDHDREFQLKTTWEILNTAAGIAAFIGAFYAANQWLNLRGGRVAEKDREGDAEVKLSRLPRWKDVS